MAAEPWSDLGLLAAAPSVALKMHTEASAAGEADGRDRHDDRAEASGRSKGSS